MANIAIIPARGGSKRLPGKNIKPLGGKPLIAWTIEAAIDSNCFDRIIVSTDDREIATVALKHGAEVPFIRPPELSGDKATSGAVIEHAIRWLEQKDTTSIETVALLQPTSPFRNAEHIKSSFLLMREKNADGIVSVAPNDTRLELCNHLPVDGRLKGFLDTPTKRTQDMQQLYELNGAIYLFKRSLAGSMSCLYSPENQVYAYVMQVEDSVDIDTELDFLWAEFMDIRRKKH